MANLSDIPALQTLQHFAAAARHLNFTTAAEELGTTQPAISLRITQLEKALGVPLFKRQHRGVALTHDGARLYEAVREGLGIIGNVTQEILARQKKPVLTVATDFGFAAYWLMPRMQALREHIPDLDVRIMTSQQVIDIRDDVIDAAIAFGDGYWPGCVAEKLLPEQVQPVCSQRFKDQHGLSDDGDWQDVPLIHLERPEPVRWISWSDWFAQKHWPAHHSGHDVTFNNYPLVIQGAMTGQGVALGWLPLVQDLLATGQLVPAATATIETQRGYFLVLRESTRLTGHIKLFRQWIHAACQTDLGIR
ncbi:choline sulfate utilization transcriptional regulator [Leeia oryzae]|uniref:choline sulfate utilization transcriptional regulator n=1 Tax=Leeia oryzae TaxID=356662 RepID=UPI00037F9397|nr:LysR substrate-binding domain-containing protein [Leeia oryzae]